MQFNNLAPFHPTNDAGLVVDDDQDNQREFWQKGSSKNMNKGLSPSASGSKMPSIWNLDG